MASYDYDFIIIGGGSAGLTAAAGAAQFGLKTMLVEKESALGGDCLHYGCVPSKTLIKSAKVLHYIKNARKYGLSPIDPGPVDFCDIRRRIEDVIAVIQEHDSEERFCKLGARVEFGQCRFADEHVLEVNGKRYSSKQFLLATGSSPGFPPVKGLSGPNILTNKEIFYLDTLPQSMIVLGAGPIGIEMAQAFARLGTRVTVVQRSEQILSAEDRDVADEVMRCIGRDGVDIRLESDLLEVKDKGDSVDVVIRDKGRTGPEFSDDPQTLNAEKVLVALGRRANVEGLALEDIGVKLSRRGIITDERLRTTHKHIYAAGDVLGRHQFTHAAGYEAGVVLTNAVFHLPKKVDYTWLTWCTYSDPEAASIGLNEKRAKAQNIDYTVRTERFSGNDRALAESESDGMLKMLLSKKGKVLGVQIVGPRAGELINEWTALLNAGAKLTTLASTVHPYPTLGEINKRAAGSVLSEKIFSPLVKKGLKFFFGFKGRACGPDSPK